MIYYRSFIDYLQENPEIKEEFLESIVKIELYQEKINLHKEELKKGVDILIRDKREESPWNEGVDSEGNPYYETKEEWAATVQEEIEACKLEIDLNNESLKREWDSYFYRAKDKRVPDYEKDLANARKYYEEAEPEQLQIIREKERRFI